MAGHWYRQLRELLPNASCVEEAVEAVESSPGMSEWQPNAGLRNRWMDIVGWGVVLKSTTGLVGASHLHAKAAVEILKFDRPDPETWGELSAAALCGFLGAARGQRLPRTALRTADWCLEWPGAMQVDLEVTVARQKPTHLRRQHAAGLLADKLLTRDLECDVVVHVIVPTIAEHAAAFCQAASQRSNNAIHTEIDKWELRREEIRREVGFIFNAEPDNPPQWWSDDQARGVFLSSVVPGPDTKNALPQVRVLCGIPFRAYMNPLINKADAPQGRTELPFLIAIDVRGLPGALLELPRAVLNYLSLWPAVSGVLLFVEAHAL